MEDALLALKKMMEQQPAEYPAAEGLGALMGLGDETAGEVLGILQIMGQSKSTSTMQGVLKALQFEPNEATLGFLVKFLEDWKRTTTLYDSSVTCKKMILRFKDAVHDLPLCTSVKLDNRHIRSDCSTTVRDQVIEDVQGKNGDVVIFVFGESGAGKTVLACQLASVSLINNGGNLVSCLFDGSELFNDIRRDLTMENYQSDQDRLIDHISNRIRDEVRFETGVGKKLLRKDKDRKTEVSIVLDEMGAAWLNVALRIIAKQKVSTKLEKDLEVDCVRFIVAGTGCDTLNGSHLVSSWERIHIVSPSSQDDARIPKWIAESNSSAATQAKALLGNWRAGELLRQTLDTFPQFNQDEGLSPELLQYCCLSACIQYKERNALRPLTEKELLSGFRHALSIVMSNQMTDLDSDAQVVASRYGMLTDDLPRFIRVYHSSVSDQEAPEMKKKAITAMQKSNVRRYHISQAQLVFYQLMVMGESIHDPSGAGFEKTVGDYLTLLGLAASFPGMKITPSLQLEKDTSTSTTTAGGGSPNEQSSGLHPKNFEAETPADTDRPGVGLYKSRQKIEPRTDPDSQETEFEAMLTGVRRAIGAGYTVVILNGDQTQDGDLLLLAPDGRWWIIQAKQYEKTKMTETEFKEEVMEMTADRSRDSPKEKTRCEGKGDEAQKIKKKEKPPKLPPSQLNEHLFPAIYGKDIKFNDPQVVFFLGGPSTNFDEVISKAEDAIIIIHHSLEAPGTDLKGFRLIEGDPMYPIIPGAVPRKQSPVVRLIPAPEFNGLDEQQHTLTKRSKRGRR